MKSPLPCSIVCLWAAMAAGANPPEPIKITHGPILGRPTANSMGLWARTSRAGSFQVRYGVRADKLDQLSDAVLTNPDHDNAGWTEIAGLSPGTRYHYEVFVSNGPELTAEHRGSFRTLPDAAQFIDESTNPRGLFNFSFEVACGNAQSPDRTGQVALPTYDTMLNRMADEVDFAILNGDFIYEERREWPVDQWQADINAGTLPKVVGVAPAIVGVWENYKLYLDRAASLRAWHRRVPSYFVFDDHEIIDDVNGSGQIGCQNRRAVFRDIGVQGWYDYLGWSNPVEIPAEIHFGRARLAAGRDVLTDERADFRRLPFGSLDNLHIHFGGQLAGVKGKALDDKPGDPNSGVYAVVEVLDEHRLRIRPTPQSDGESSYSIGRFSFFRLQMANCDIFVLDTRGHRQVASGQDRANSGRTILGERQKQWLMEQMRRSDAELFFVVSSVNFMVPHLVDVGQDDFTGYDDAWTAFLAERNEMLHFWDSLGKPVLIITGDLHNSFVAEVTDRVWEFAAGPHNSGNARAASEGDRPANGVFDSFGQPCQIRWSTYERDDTATYRQRVYCIVQVNNVFRNASRDNPDRWVAFPRPQAIVQFYDGDTGRLLYAESIVSETARP